MYRKVMLAAGLALLLLLTAFAMPGPVAHAQGGGGDKVVFGQSYTLGTGERLSGNLTVLGGNVTLEKGSRVEGDVVELGGSLSAAGEIRGNLSVFGGSLDLASTAVVQGDLATFGGALREAPGAQVRGRTVQSFRAPQLGDNLPALPLVPQPPAAPAVPASPANPPGPGLFGRFVIWQLATLGWAVLLALLGVGAILLAPRHMERIASTVATGPVFSVAVGLLTLIVAPLAGGLLLLACGLGLLVWFAAFLGLLVGWLAVGLWLGQRLLRALRLHTASSLPEIALGVFLITVVARLPCIGFLVALVAGSLGLGAVVLTRFGTRPFVRTHPPASYLGPRAQPAGLVGPGASTDDDRALC
jgi:hypothetical protein